MADPAPSPNPPPDHPGRAAQWVLAGFAVLALALLGYRGYGNGLAVRPTDHFPATARHRVDLNTADKTELLQVPGIGPSLADAILSHRRDRGPFGAVDELDGVKGVGDKTLGKLRPWLAVADGPPASPGEVAVERLERKPVPPPAPVAAPPAVKSGKVQAGEPPIDVNAADEGELQRLPGVGPVMARKIVEARGLARFGRVEDLRKVRGIGVKTLENLRPYVVCR